MSERRKNRIRALQERREYVAYMAKLRRIFGVGFAVAALVVFVLVVVVRI